MRPCVMPHTHASHRMSSRGHGPHGYWQVPPSVRFGCDLVLAPHLKPRPRALLRPTSSVHVHTVPILKLMPLLIGHFGRLAASKTACHTKSFTSTGSCPVCTTSRCPRRRRCRRWCDGSKNTTHTRAGDPRAISAISISEIVMGEWLSSVGCRRFGTHTHSYAASMSIHEDP